MTDVDLALDGLEDDEVEAIVGGLCFYQMHALRAWAVPKVDAAGRTLRKIAEQNPDATRQTLLENRDIEVQGGRVLEATGDDEPTAVEVDDAD